MVPSGLYGWLLGAIGLHAWGMQDMVGGSLEPLTTDGGPQEPSVYSAPPGLSLCRTRQLPAPSPALCAPHSQPLWPVWSLHLTSLSSPG